MAAVGGKEQQVNGEMDEAEDRKEPNADLALSTMPTLGRDSNTQSHRRHKSTSAEIVQIPPCSTEEHVKTGDSTESPQVGAMSRPRSFPDARNSTQ